MTVYACEYTEVATALPCERVQELKGIRQVADAGRNLPTTAVQERWDASSRCSVLLFKR